MEAMELAKRGFRGCVDRARDASGDKVAKYSLVSNFHFCSFVMCLIVAAAFLSSLSAFVSLPRVQKISLFPS